MASDSFRDTFLGFPLWSLSLVASAAGSRLPALASTGPVMAGGEILWMQTYGDEGADGAFAVEPAGDGGLVFAGFYSAFWGSYTDVHLVKTDAGGNALWSRTFGGPMNDYGAALARTSDGGFAVAGYGDSEDGSSWDTYLLRTDELGVELWSETYGGAMDDRGWSVLPSADGHLLVAGWTYSSGAGQGDALLLKVADGDLFRDGFESGDTSAWSLVLPSPLEAGPGRNRATRDRSRGESSR